MWMQVIKHAGSLQVPVYTGQLVFTRDIKRLRHKKTSVIIRNPNARA